MVPVRIERTSANSRKISGEITVDASIDQVWSILTDYNRLATHVPNLIQSRIVTPGAAGTQPGDGTYNCRLYQQGAQKIVGFRFVADVKMEMQERILTPAEDPSAIELKVPPEDVESCYFPIVQSGGSYDFRVSAVSSEKKNLAIRYRLSQFGSTLSK